MQTLLHFKHAQTSLTTPVCDHVWPAPWKCCCLPLERVASDAIFARNGNMPLEGKSNSELWGNFIKINATDLCAAHCLLKRAFLYITGSESPSQ